VFVICAARAAERFAITDDALLHAAAAPREWLTHGRDYAETRYSPLKQITSANVGRLGLAWYHGTATVRGLEATPLVANGVIYATAPWSVVFALDARTGALRWQWDPQVRKAVGRRACCDVVNRGVALYDGKVYLGVLDGRLAALDAETGKLLWQTQTTDPDEPYTITGAPRVVKGKIIIGNGGAEYGVRGYVSAYDAQSGALAWRFYTVPGDPSKPFESTALAVAAQTWSGQWWTMGGGGTVWDALAYDAEADLLYVGTGNGSPWNREIRSPGGGDNLYLSSILALDPDTGELAWHYQTTPGDSWDYTAVQHMILADLSIDGRERKVLMQAPKNGFFYVLDRLTGELISAEPYVTVTWAEGVHKATGRPIERPHARYSDQVVMLYPGPGGGHNWHPMSFNPNTGLVYIPATEGGFPYVADAAFEYRKGTWNLGIDLKARSLPARFPAPVTEPVVTGPAASLLAWDPVKQQERWRAPYQTGAGGGTLTTAGNLLFQGTMDGRFIAYSADRGERLWETQLGNSVMAAPITYELDDVQYVAVLAGWGGAGAGYGINPAGVYKAEGRLWSFKLDGGAIEPVKSASLPAPQPIAFDAKPELIAQGEVLYADWCYVCHGGGAASGGMFADLRHSTPAVVENYPRILLEGAFESLGMPSFRAWLTLEEVEAIRAYVLSQRQKLTAAE
jgi:quinohemoprotein ethanol dehydrogenase